jgi:hypothetical protein
VLLLVPGATAALATLALPDLLDARRALASGAWAHQPFDRVLVWGAEVAALACLGWLSVVTVAVAAPALRARPGEPPARARGCPVWLHRALLAACGVGLTAALGTPAHADLPQRSATGGTAGDPHVVAGLPYPDRAHGGAVVDTAPAPRSVPRAGFTTASAPHPAGAAGPGRLHAVRPGDTLWDIAAADLGPGAPDAAVADHWRRIHRHNAEVLGPDPDLIHPGTVLRMPHE